MTELETPRRMTAAGRRSLRSSIAILIALFVGPAVATGETGDPVHVCVDAVGAVRLIEMKESCPAGQTSLYLAQAEPTFEELKETEPDQAAQIEMLERRLAALEKAIASKPTPVRNQVVAPFEVIDRTGEVIFSVERDFVKLFHAGQAQAQIAVGESGANIVLGTTLRAHLYSFAGDAGFSVDDKGTERIALGTGESGNHRLVFLTPDGKTIAGIGETTQGTGAVRVGTAEGGIRASMQLDDEGKGLVAIMNDAGLPIAALKEGANGGGLLEITNAQGEPMVHAGVHPDGYGVVRTGPASFATGAGLGLPGSYIIGRK